MRDYEITIILKTTLDDDARNELIERVAGWLNPQGEEATAPKVDHWGQRHMAYPIKNERDGYYVQYVATLDPDRVNPIERDILYEEDILRHLVVRKDD